MSIWRRRACLQERSETGISDGGGAPGTWSSDPYAPNGNVRPTGINGTFHAHFGDGHAMGVYATRNIGDDAADM